MSWAIDDLVVAPVEEIPDWVTIPWLDRLKIDEHCEGNKYYVVSPQVLRRYQDLLWADGAPRHNGVIVDVIEAD